VSRSLRTLIPSLLVTTCVLVGCHGDEPPTGGNGTARPGTVVWRVGIASPSRAGTLAADTSHVYVYRGGLAISAIRLRDHTEAWTAASDEVGDPNFSMRGVSVCGQNVIFGSPSVGYAVNARTGERQWKWRPSAGGLLSYAAPTCAAGNVLITTGSPMRVYAVDATTGVEKWAANLDRRSGGNGFVATPRVADGVVIACTREFGVPLGGMIVGLEQTTGREIWRYEWQPQAPIKDAGCAQFVAVGGGLALGSADDGRIFALDLQSGVLRWTLPAIAGFLSPGDERPISILDGVVIVGSLSNIVVAADLATGRELWRTEDALPGATVVNRGFVGDGGQFAAANLSGWALAFDARTGQRPWTVKPVSVTERVLFGPGVLTPTLYIAVGSDGIYAIRR
jgi:outer membrane protein assembly factor BamB